MAILVLYAKIKLFDGSYATGPVTTQDFERFLFKNTGSDLDLYFNLKKDNNHGWNFAGGPDMEIPVSFIEQVGQQIDRELVTK